VVSVLGPLLDSNTIPVVTGFIGQTVDGKITTLGRGASDYTATILGYCLDAKQVWIWTDVTGVMTADPRLIPEAKTIAQLSYAEASELSYFGAKVLHPLTMVPASLKNIPIFIKNTFEPEQIGTRIAAHTDDGGVKAITVKSELSLLTVQGKGVTGVPSVAAKVFGALASERIDVYMISQASSEHNISFVVKGSSGVLAVEKVHSALVDEMSSKDVDIVQLKNGLSIVAVVGNDMYNLPGVTGKTFASMGVSGVEIIAISYGSSERSISFVVESADAVTAIKSLHHTFQLVKKR
jgi:aspartate kinase